MSKLMIALAVFVCACSKPTPQDAPMTEVPQPEPAPKPWKPKALTPVGTLASDDPPAVAPTDPPIKSTPAPATKPKAVSVIDLPGGLWSPWEWPDLKALGLPAGFPSTWPIPSFSPPPTTSPPATPTTSSTAPAPKSGPNVILYAASWCPHCKTAKAHIEKRGIAYTYRDVDDDDANAELAVKLKKAGISKGGIPTTDIEGDLLVGWSEEQFDKTYDEKSKK